MNKSEIIERLKNIAGYAVHTVGEEPFVMSLDDGIAVHKAIELLEKPIQPNHNAEVSKMEIIRCKDCKHWNLQVGNVKGDGLGSCDFHNVNLVTGEGFCYWADRRDEEYEQTD